MKQTKLYTKGMIFPFRVNFGQP